MRSTLVFLLLLVTIDLGQSFFDINDLDWSIRPTDDFYMFVNGRWLNKTTIPPTLSRWGGMNTIEYDNLYQLQQILDDLIKYEQPQSPYPAHSIERKLVDFYLAGQDEEAIERAGIEPLKQTLIELHETKTYQELIMFILNWYKKMNQGLIFLFMVHADGRNSSNNMAIWKQTGIQLPERDYYFRNDLISKNIRSNYVSYIHRLLTLSDNVLNITTELIDAEDVLSLETQLAVSHRTPSELKDRELNYNKYTINHLDEMMPNLGWHRILSILGIKNETVLMSQPDYYILLDKLILSRSLNTWKNKIRFTLLHGMSTYLSKDFDQAHFHMFNHLIHGQKENKVRWMKILQQTDTHVGEALGKLYVSRHFSLQSKERMIKLVNNLMQVYRERIYHINWLSKSTKMKALKKLKTLNIKIGYPSKWKSYDDVHINRSSYFDSISSILKYGYTTKMNDLKKTVDRDEWIFSPQTVNAGYNPSSNDITFPAAILQKPFFSFDADDALNYGGIGCIIGHELTHALDDQGRKYDEQGNLRLWWTPEDINAFNSRTEMLVEQFNSYRVLNQTINGRLTLGENIADLGGVEIAYQAFLRTKQANDNILIDGLTPKQRFFLAFGRVWRLKITNAKLLFDIKQSSHAPASIRINGPLSNMLGFYQTFNVTKGDEMFREAENRVLIW